MVELQKCEIHGDERMVYEGRQDRWYCALCEYPEIVREDDDEDRDLIYKLKNNRDALDYEIDTIGSVELRKLIEIALERV